MNTLPTPWEFPEGYVLYENRTEEEKYEYWNTIFFQNARAQTSGFYPIKLADYIKREPKFEEFLPKIIDMLFLACFWKLRQILQYDEDTEKYFVQYWELKDVQEYYKQQGYLLEKTTKETQNNVNNILTSEE